MSKLRLSGIRKHILFLAVLAAYLLSASTLYERIFIHYGRPETANISLPEASTAAIVKISDLRLTRVEGQDVYELRGFAFLRSFPHQPNRIRVIFQSADGNQVFATQPAIAPAMIVSSAYKNAGVEHSEFRALISKYAVPLGSYEIGILLEPLDGEASVRGPAYTLTGAKVRRTPNYLRYTRAPDPE